MVSTRWFRRRLILALGVVAFAGPALAVEPTVIGFDPQMVHHDPDGSAYLSVRDSSGIFDAMERGDEPALLTIKAQLDADSSGQPSLVQTIIAGLCDAAIARVHGDLDTSDTILDRLSRRLGPLGSPERSINPLGFMIDLTRSANQLLHGDVRNWAGTQEAASAPVSRAVARGLPHARIDHQKRRPDPAGGAGRIHPGTDGGSVVN